MNSSWIKQGYFGAATGKGRQAAKSEIEKLKLSELLLTDAVKEAARIIHVAHDDNKDKPFELEMTWVRQDKEGGIPGGDKKIVGNGWLHEEVPREMVDEALELAKKMDEDDDEEGGKDIKKEDEKMDED